ncbi:hypothetical protein LP421_07910 [Rhizobium sp. RCAM05350]|nr:hypothetical protein LP421_07910 [Rhizobium sp. RCAM05350]
MRRPAIYQFRRAEVEARIEDLIALLDMLDGDLDLEDDELEDIDEREPPLARVGVRP